MHPRERRHVDGDEQSRWQTDIKSASRGTGRKHGKELGDEGTCTCVAAWSMRECADTQAGVLAWKGGGGARILDDQEGAKQAQDHAAVGTQVDAMQVLQVTWRRFSFM